MALTDEPGGPTQKERSVLGSILPYTTVAVLIAALYVAWTFYSRHESAQRSIQEVEQKRHDSEKKSYDVINPSSEVSFTTFEAAAPSVQAGQTTQLCYGVMNAKHVNLDPPASEALQPSYRHCFDIAPKKTTKYTITADDGAGHSKSASLTVRVQ